VKRTAIVGCGGIAQTHAEALSNMPHVELVAVCDILPERAEALKEKFAPSAHVYNDLANMLAAEKIDVLHICTPHYLHCEMACAALERDIHVLLEKPVCITMEQVEKLAAAEEKSKAKICISFQNRYLARNKRVKELIASGEAGEVQSAFASVLWHRTKEYYVNSHWRGFMATEGGGVMINQAIHTLDLLLWCCGEVKTLSATTANHHLKGVIDVEDTCESLLTFKSGAQALWFATTANPTDDPVTLVIRCKNMTMELKDDDLFINGVPQHLVDSTVLSSGKSYWGIGHSMLFQDFYNRLEAGKEMPIGVREASKALRVLLAMYASKGNDIEL